MPVGFNTRSTPTGI